MSFSSWSGIENLTSPQTFDDFNRILYWPHMFVYILYLAQKLLILLGLCCVFVCEGKSDQDTLKWIQCCDLFGCLVRLCTCCYACFCCFSCCGREEGLADKFSFGVYKCRTMFDRWIVNVILGKEERIVSRANDYKDDKPDAKGVSKLFIRNAQLEHIHIRLLTLLVLTFGLLTAGSAWSTFIFNITNVCVDDHSNIHCFALHTDLKVPLSSSGEPITNCSRWTSSSEVEITCFQFAYNTADALATFGGLLALFQIVVTAATNALLTLINYFLLWENESNNQNTRLCCIRVTVESCRVWIKRIRIVISVIIGLLELSVAIFFAFRLTKLGDPNIGLVTNFLQKHGSQILIVVAIIGTIPLLPLEKYAVPYNQNEERCPLSDQALKRC